MRAIKTFLSPPQLLRPRADTIWFLIICICVLHQLAECLLKSILSWPCEWMWIVPFYYYVVFALSAGSTLIVNVGLFSFFFYYKRIHLGFGNVHFFWVSNYSRWNFWGIRYIRGSIYSFVCLFWDVVSVACLGSSWTCEALLHPSGRQHFWCWPQLSFMPTLSSAVLSCAGVNNKKARVFISFMYLHFKPCHNVRCALTL